MKGEYLKPIPQNVTDFLAMPKGPRKNVVAESLRKDYTVIGVLKEGDDVSYYVHSLKLQGVNGSYFLRPIRKTGMSYKDGKVSLWFGATITQLGHARDYFKPLFDYMGWDFISKDECHGTVWSLITKGILEKLFKGKITNTRQLLAAYVKANRINVSTELLYEEMKRVSFNKRDFLYHASVAKDVNHYLEWRVANVDQFYNPELTHKQRVVGDLAHQFKLLEKKIDFKWSLKRMEEEHKKATKELMEYQLASLSDEEIPYPALPYPPEFELLNSERKIFAEGKIMNHCVFTNYAKDIKNRNYLAFHVTLNGEEATLGVYLSNHKEYGPIVTFNQVYGKHNKVVSEEMDKFCMNWIETVKVKLPPNTIIF